MLQSLLVVYLLDTALKYFCTSNTQSSSCEGRLYNMISTGKVDETNRLLVNLRSHFSHFRVKDLLMQMLDDVLSCWGLVKLSCG